MRALDPVIRLLAFLMIFFTIALMYAEHMFHADAAVFQVISNVLSGLVGGFLMGIRKELGLPDDSTTVQRSTTVTTIPAVPVPPASLIKEPTA